MKKLYYYCVQCKEIFGCVKNGNEVKCSVCEVSCRWDGAAEKYFKFDIGEEQLSHEICGACYYLKRGTDVIEVGEWLKQKGG